MGSKKRTMAASPKRSRKPRVRKAAPTVREQIEVSAKESDNHTQSKKGSLGSFWSSVWRLLRIVFRPIAPIGRFLKKYLRWLVPKYFINSWRELKLVTWPTRKETWRLTAAVFIFAVVFGALVAVVDKGLDEIFKKVILK